MKTKTLVKSLVAFSILIAVSIGIALACAGDDGDWFGYSDFAPENFADKSYAPLFYSSGEMFYGIGYNDNHVVRFKDEITKDWQGYLKGSISDKDLDFFLYDNKSDVAITALYDYVTNNKKSTTVTAWAKKLNYDNKLVKSFIEFLYFAKEVEKSSVSYFDYWDYENEVKASTVNQEIIRQIKSKYLSTKEPFLKNRYWFQTMKAYFYSDTKSEGILFFEDTKNDVPRNTLYYRGLAYIAGVNYKAGNFARSNYLYSRVFDECPAMRTEAAYSFHPQDENDWQQALEMAKNNDEKAALWALLGYYHDAGRSIKEIYKLNSKNQHLNYLLTRLINKQEEAIGSISMELVSDYKAKVKEQIIQSDINTVKEIAQAGNTLKPYFWNLAAGYLETLNGNFKQANSFFDIAEKQLPDEKLIKNQLRLFCFVNKLSHTGKMDADAENNLLPDLEWLYHDLAGKTIDNFRYSKALWWSKSYISVLYKQQNNEVFAQLFSPGSKFYYHSGNTETMKSFLLKPNKNPFEKLAAGIYPLTLADIYEYQAVMSTFEDKTEEAFEYMKKAVGRNEITLLANPFNGFIKDCHDCEHAAQQKTKFSKLRFVEILKIMQSKIKNGEDLYNNYLLLGNAFYSITFYGNARVFYEGNIIGSNMSSSWGFDDYYEKIIFDMSNAKKYYQKAYEVATTNEQKAKCSYMLAKCERNEYYNQNENTDNYYGNNSKPDFLAWDGFKKLKTKYSSTKYYKEVIAECEYFAKYAGN